MEVVHKKYALLFNAANC